MPFRAVEGTWTLTQVHGHEPESCAYANSATTADAYKSSKKHYIRMGQISQWEKLKLNWIYFLKKLNKYEKM